MLSPTPERGHPALLAMLGHWRGKTLVAAGPWGPEHSLDAEVTYSQVAGGLGVVQSYRHAEPDGSHFEGHGIFTVDPVHNDVLWYYIDNHGAPPGTAARCTWHDHVLRVERRGAGRWTRHSIWVEGGVLTHVTELRSAAKDGHNAPETGDAPESGDAAEAGNTPKSGDSPESGDAAEADDVPEAGTDGRRSAYKPFMRSVFHKA
ncbi:DUF1579 family protein [Pseudarthrobacter sp. fls2-241-R2A-127]|uniref:DUF1579 family protein n=1 Tax=Pseudarthrobacter sp. fls2-241-R2A-127 TaxID=3040303 RepID=UPI003305F93E